MSDSTDPLDLCLRLFSAANPTLGYRARVASDVCRLIEGEEYFSAEDYSRLHIAARLAYIGMIRIPKTLLGKISEESDDITESEREHYERHPVYAHELLEGCSEEVRAAGELIRYSRERWDGSGFPMGLARERIPEAARFLAIACFYADSSLSKQRTIERIEALSGKAFYPEAVRLFLKTCNTDSLPDKVRELMFRDLKPGMILARPIHTPTGVLLYPESQPIDPESLDKLSDFNNVEPIWDRILVVQGT